MFDAVIFDWDGTLADTKDVIVLSFQTVLKEIGCMVSNEFLEKRIGVGVRNMLIAALDLSSMPHDDGVLDALVEEKNRMHAQLSDRIEMFDGAADLLASLHGQLKVALATMSNRSVIDKLLWEKGIGKYFDLVITANDVRQPKPHPEVFLKSAVKLHCHPSKCVVVEDSVFGVIAAKNADMKCIAIVSGAYTASELTEGGADLIVNSLTETQEILDYIFTSES